MGDGSSLFIPRRLRGSGVTAGLKASGLPDLAVLASDEPCSAAGAFTLNRMCTAGEMVSRKASSRRHSSGGDQLRQCQRLHRRARLGRCPEMARLAAAACGCPTEQVLVMSTGIIGELLPMEKIAAGIAEVAKQSGNDEASPVTAAARHDDDRHAPTRSSALSNSLGGRTIQPSPGMAKGAAMIGPRMATMLALSPRPMRRCGPTT